MKKTIYSLLCFCVAVCTGIYISFVGVDMGRIHTRDIASVQSRSPAAIKKIYDFSNLEGSALDTASKQRLISGVNVLKDRDDVGIELGHFVIRGPAGEKQFACEQFKKVILIFEGDGVAIAGEKAKMEVEGECQASTDINSISPVWIPVQKILAETVADGEIDYRDGRHARVKFSNVIDTWPKLWQLRMVKLYDESTSREVSVPADEIRAHLGRPVVIEF